MLKDFEEFLILRLRTNSSNHCQYFSFFHNSLHFPFKFGVQFFNGFKFKVDCFKQKVQKEDPSLFDYGIENAPLIIRHECG